MKIEICRCKNYNMHDDIFYVRLCDLKNQPYSNVVIETDIHKWLNIDICDYWELCRKCNCIPKQEGFFENYKDVEKFRAELMPYVDAIAVTEKLLKST